MYNIVHKVFLQEHFVKSPAAPETSALTHLSPSFLMAKKIEQSRMETAQTKNSARG
jgi:hypothetical protein